MRCGDRRKFDVDQSKTKLSKNRQSTTSVHWRVGLKGLTESPLVWPYLGHTAIKKILKKSLRIQIWEVFCQFLFLQYSITGILFKP